VFYSREHYGTTRSRDYEPPNSASGLHLLGYIQGHYDQDDAGEKLNMGIALVVPVSEILSALEFPPFAAKRKSEFETDLKNRRDQMTPSDD
jgi:hypothetical protein